MASVSYQIANLLEKMQSTDKDFRFMATNDLMGELQKDSIKLDDDSERKVVKMLLKLLEDKNGEVQNLAVKCLGPLVNKVKEYQVETIVESLCTNMVSEKEQLRDISSIGLKTVIAELPQAPGGLSGNICKHITSRLTTAIERQEDVSVQLEALDIVADLLARFGNVLAAFHASIIAALLPQLSSTTARQAVRKRTIACLSNLVVSCNAVLYGKLMNFLNGQLDGTDESGRGEEQKKMQVRTCIQCVAAVCRQSGHRFGAYIENYVAIVMRYIRQEEDDELREFCIQAFEAFVTRCPKEITPHIPEITALCVKYLTYDPNYNYDDEEDEDSLGNRMDTNDDRGDDDDDIDGDDDGDEYSDDDDMSWKVRRASAKCLESIISSRHELICEFYKSLSPVLIARFKEREENVKSDIFHAYIALLKQTKTSTSITSTSLTFVPASNKSSDPDNSMEQETAISLLQQQVPSLVKSVSRQMRERSIKTRQDCFVLLRELCSVLPGALTNHIGELMPGLHYSLGSTGVTNPATNISTLTPTPNTTSSNLKIDALHFIHRLLLTHPIPAVHHPHIPTLLPLIIAATRDPFYKIASEALCVLSELVQVIRPLDNDLRGQDGFDFREYVGVIYTSTLARLRAAPDADQEVRERAIGAMGRIVCHMGDAINADELNNGCMPVLVSRLANETSRLVTVEALRRIAGSPLRIDLLILGDAIPVLGSFLRKNQRALKLATLALLDCLIKNYHRRLTPELLRHVTVELAPLLDESDLHIAQWALVIMTSIARHHPFTLMDISVSILPEVMNLVRSPLLQGAALVAMLDFFRALVQCKIPNLDYDQLLQMLLSNANSPNTPQQQQQQQSAIVHKQAYYSLAKCIAAISTMDDGEDRNKTLRVARQFAHEMRSTSSDTHRVFCLLIIGEIGRIVDLTPAGKLENDIIDSFGHVSEEVKSAASYSLGSISIGNLRHYLPVILREIENQPKRQYLLLHSLKEIITCLSSTSPGVCQLTPFVTEIWQQLFGHCESSEEGTRNVVAECLGKLTLIDPSNLLSKLQASLESPSSLMRTTVVTAVKFTISDQPQPIDPLLRQCIGQFLNTLEDPDLNVRRVALVAFNSAAHNKPTLIRDLLDTILPRLYGETKVKKGLIREVEMGPFKHTVDDGLDIRKAAFECMYTLLDSCLDRIDIFEFLNQVEAGLRDHYDIKMLTHLMVGRLTIICPTAILQRLDRLVDPLRVTCTIKVKANSVKQEYEKQDELKRSALRAVVALLSLPDADKNPQLNEFVAFIRNSADLLAVFESIQKDTNTSSIGGNSSSVRSGSSGVDSILMDQS